MTNPPEALRPCPFCNKPATRKITEFGDYAQFSCDCVQGDEDNNSWTDTIICQEAYCWKRIDELENKIAHLQDQMEAQKEDEQRWLAQMVKERQARKLERDELEKKLAKARERFEEIGNLSDADKDHTFVIAREALREMGEK
jgi:hypothetical protein